MIDRPEAQKIQLLAYKAAGRRDSVIVEHSRIVVPNGDVALRGPLEAYAIPATCPQEPGLWLLDADAYASGGRGLARLQITESVRLTLGLAEMQELNQANERKTSD